MKTERRVYQFSAELFLETFRTSNEIPRCRVLQGIPKGSRVAKYGYWLSRQRFSSRATATWPTTRPPDRRKRRSSSRGKTRDAKRTFHRRAMSIISDSVFAGKPEAPPRLYHYSSQEGLLGILDSKTLWATRIQYLNDSTEFAYTLTLLRKEFDLQHQKPLEKRFSLDPISNAFDNLRLIPIYVACFSEKQDDLSQWRGYCPGGGGFSIGFDTNQLVKAAKRRGAFMAPCVYDFHRQSQLVEQLVDRFIKQSMTEGVDAKEKVAWDFTMDCIFLACFLKHPSFKDEQEWRIAPQAISPTDPQLAFRTSRAVLVPYLRFELTEPEAPLDIHLVVGPNAEMELALESATRLLAAKKCTGPPVSASIVPYRLL